jgi:hypothetical protein
MKLFKRIVWGLLLFLAVFYVLPAGMMQLPYFQKKISQKAAGYLEEKFHTKVNIERIELGFLNKLILKNIYMEDQSGDTLFQAKRMAAGFEILPLFKKQWRFNAIQLFTFQFNLNRETADSPLNIQYILDVFAGNDTIPEDNRIDLQIRRLNLYKGNFSYRVKQTPKTPSKLNVDDLALTEIFSKIRLEKFSEGKLSLVVNKLGFKEQSGFYVKNLVFDLTADKGKALIRKLKLDLNESSLLLSDISADYGKAFSEKKGLENAEIQFKLSDASIFPDELSAFVPNFSEFEDKININGDFSGTLNNLTISDLYFRFYNHLMIRFNAHVENLFDKDTDAIFIDGAVNESFFSLESVERMVNNFSKTPFELPQPIKQLENIHFDGAVKGYLKDLAATGTLETGAGIIRANVALGKTDTRFLRGEIASEGLNLEKLLNDKDYGEVVFDIKLDAKQNPDKKSSGTLDANIKQFVYKGYAYNNLTLNGAFLSTCFQGVLNLDSPEGKIFAEGLFDFNGFDSNFKFTALAENLQLDKLNLVKKYQNSLLSFKLDADFSGNEPDNLLGFVSLTNLDFQSDKGAYHLNKLLINSTQSEQEKRLSIDSEILKGEIQGNYTFSTLIPAIKQTFANYLPSVFKTDIVNKSDVRFSVNLAIEDLSSFAPVFDLPFILHGQTQITGEYDNVKDKFNLTVNAPEVDLAGSNLKSTQIALKKEENTAQLEIRGINRQEKSNPIEFTVQMDAKDDRLNASLNWKNGSPKYGGEIDLSAFFSKPRHAALQTKIDIKQSSMVFNDSVWTLYPAVVQIDSAAIRIDRILASHKEQFIKIDGAISHNPDEIISVDLNKVDLEYLFKSLNIKALEFGGIASGYANAQDIYHTKKLSTHLDVKDFSFNNVIFGDLKLSGDWDDASQSVLMNGYAFKNDSTQVNIDGAIYPEKEEISIHFDAQNTEMRFLRKYLDKVVQQLSGTLSGHLHLFGDLNHPTVEGDVFAKNCRFGVGFLNTFYTFTDSVKCYPDEIRMKNVLLFDEKGKSAMVNAYAKHRLFDDFRFSATISYTDFMVFNATKSPNPLFYGTAYGTGTATLSGTENLVNIDVSMQNTEDTKMTMNFMEKPDIADYDFIRFTTAKKDTLKKEATAAPAKLLASNSSPETEIRLNLLLDVTPQARLEIITDPVSEDKISANGTGNMQIQYGTKIPLKVIGKYAIESGKYNFSLQKVIFRTFDIQEGSSVSFIGNPYTAELAIKANYNVTANLGDLDRRLLEQRQSTRDNVPVNCILQLNGPLNHPGISFDLNLPGATSELNRQVKSYIRTEDMMNRQIAYLLVLNRFYTAPEYSRDETQINNNLSFLTSTLSTQFSNMLGLLSEKVRPGIKFHQTYEGEQTSTEVEFLLSSQLLNNRLIINGNFGYISSPYLNNEGQNATPLIGDFDLEYKLTENGEIRLKGFSRYDYRNYYSLKPEMTQGIGILFRKDFNRFSELFRKKDTKSTSIQTASDTIK